MERGRGNIISEGEEMMTSGIHKYVSLAEGNYK